MPEISDADLIRWYYDYYWQNTTRPRILRRAFGRFDEKGKYQGAAKCEKCGYIDCVLGGRSELDIAHLVIPAGDPGHDDDTNLAALCRKCHRAHDYASWAAKFSAWLKGERDRKIEERDRERPILQLLQETTWP